MMSSADETLLISALNTLSAFLASPDLLSLTDLPRPCGSTVFVLCGSAILPTADHVFSTLAANPPLTSTLVICGGIGHSTNLLYDAVRQLPHGQQLLQRFPGLDGKTASDRIGVSESEILFEILRCNYAHELSTFTSLGGTVLLESRSTNCGANAIETRKTLEANRVSLPEQIVIIQDPTMARRTVAGFEKVYDDVPLDKRPRLTNCPTFVPVVRTAAHPVHESSVKNQGAFPMEHLTFDVPNVAPSELWEMPRFIDLLLGEIPRLRDDKNGYGPNGKGFITHVNIPRQVEEAWGLVNTVYGAGGILRRGQVA